MGACYHRLCRASLVPLLASALAFCAAAARAGPPAATADDPASQAASSGNGSGLGALLERLGVGSLGSQVPGLAAPRGAPAPPPGPAGSASFEDRPEWRPLTILPRGDHSAVYDPARGRMIVLMGAGYFHSLYPDTLPERGVDFFNDAQALALTGEPRWTALPVLPHGHRSLAAAIFDPIHDRVIVHGGFDIAPVDGPPGFSCGAWDDLWELEFSPTPTWKEIQPAGPRPSGRYGHAAIYDPVRKRALFFGGTQHDPDVPYCWRNTLLADLWELSLEGAPAWRQIAESGEVPTPGLQGTAFYDPARDRMLLVVKDSVWAMTLDPAGTWTRLATTRGDPSIPDGPAALDQSRDRILVFSGTVAWELPLAGPLNWRRVDAQGTPPPDLRRSSVMWDPQGDRLVVFGGVPNWAVGIPTDETWFLSFRDGPRWESALPREPEMVMHKAVYDPVRDRVIAVGGSATPGAWAFSLAAPGHWTELTASGPYPHVPRAGHGAVYDAKRDRVLVYGGVMMGPTAFEPQADTWALSLTGTPSWSLLPAAAGPDQACAFFSLVLDPRRDRLLLFGGRDEAGTARNDVWQLALGDPAANWEHVDVSGTAPTPRFYHDAIYDPVRDRMLVAGGTENGTPYWLTQLWALEDLGGAPRWTLLDANGPMAEAASLVYDPVRDQAILLSGYQGQRATWACQLEGGIYWTPLDWHWPDWDDMLPILRTFHASVYDPVRDQVVVSGGFGRGYYRQDVNLRDVWALVFGEPVRDLAIDIRPGSEENVVNPGSNGVLPVAVLSDALFDATTIDPASVKLAGAGVRVRANGSPMAFRQDVNGDGRADFVLHVESSELKLAPGDTIAKLTGMAPGNTTVRGSDHVRVVGGARPPKPGPAPLEAEPVVAPALLAVRSLPGSGLRVSLALRPDAPAALDLLDIAGRRVRGLALEGGTGTREVRLGDGALTPGVYWVRLRQVGLTFTRKAIVLR